MKRSKGLIPQMMEYDNLLLAFWKASKGKRHASAVLRYQQKLQDNLLILKEQIRTGCVEVGDYHHFMVYEPKPRNICASAFSEQVLHHALMNIAHPRFEQAQIYDSYASRKGKGTYAALDRAKKFTRRYAWYLKLDVRKFFDSIHHEVLKEQLARMFKEKEVLQMFGSIIDSYTCTPGRGVPIGNLTSQYFANHYLSGLDHYIKEALGVPAYVRYMDDMVLWNTDKTQLKVAFRAVHSFIQERLHCELKPLLLQRSAKGLPFLGYRIFPGRVQLLQKSKQRFIRKLSRIETQLDEGSITEATAQCRALPLLAFTTHANTGAFRAKVLTKLGDKYQRATTV
jgi:RNA-directed DNA polymerase